MKKGQSSIEFIILISAVITFFIIAVIYLQQNLLSRQKEEANLILKDTALHIQEEISLAVRASEGYKRDFLLPVNILGRNYSINVSNQIIYLYTLDNKYALTLPTQEINGTFYSGKNTITKNKGIIYINPLDN
jgi:uncharacterized protein (UPF0333 family)